MSQYRKTKYPKSAMVYKGLETVYAEYFHIMDVKTRASGSRYNYGRKPDRKVMGPKDVLEIYRLESFCFYEPDIDREGIPAAFLQGF